MNAQIKTIKKAYKRLHLKADALRGGHGVEHDPEFTEEVDRVTLRVLALLKEKRL